MIKNEPVSLGHFGQGKLPSIRLLDRPPPPINFTCISYLTHPARKNTIRTEEKRCTVNHVAEFVKRNSDSQRTEVQRYTEVKTLRCTERSDLRSPFLLLFWSSVSTPLLEFRYYSALGAPLLLLFWSSVSRALMLNPIGAN